MDLASGRRKRLVIILVVVTACYWVGMFVGTHIPHPPPTGTHNSLDKLQHLSAFAGLAVLLCIVGAARRVSTRLLTAAVLAIAAVYGAIDELTQVFAANRSPDAWDWLADILGTGLGITIFLLFDGSKPTPPAVRSNGP